MELQDEDDASHVFVLPLSDVIQLRDISSDVQKVCRGRGKGGGVLIILYTEVGGGDGVDECCRYFFPL